MKDPLGAFRLGERDRRHLSDEFRSGRWVHAQSLPRSGLAYLSWALHHEFGRPVVTVVDSPNSLETLYHDMLALRPDREELLSFFPAREASAARGGAPHPDLVGDRLRTLQVCSGPEGPVIVLTCIQALLQDVPAPGSIARASERIPRGGELDPEAFANKLAEAGYTFEVEVTAKGQASRRGGLVDIWPPTEPWPVRIEFFGDVIDSIRTFDPYEQRSLERLEELRLSPAEEQQPAEENADPPTLLDYLPENTLWIWDEPESIYHHAGMYRALLAEDDPARDRSRFEDIRLRVTRNFTGGQLAAGLDSEQASPACELDLQPCNGLAGQEGKTPRPDLLEQARAEFVAGLIRDARKGQQVYLFFNTDGARDRFLELHAADPAAISGLDIRVSHLSEGFISRELGFTAVAESDLYGIRKIQPGRYELHGKRRGPARTAGPRLAEWTDVQPGELVVHIEHGIGKYLGLYEIEFDGRLQEALAIEYADKAKLYVPVSQTHLLSRYVGVGHRRPKLHSLGGKRWHRDKIAAEKAVRDLASVLLDTQARRSTLAGHAFSKDTGWQHEFETTFPFQETDDQHRAIDEVKHDMESHRPMDRLVCGDVGYGKTEVAMRAAFKCVMDGRQVAVLVPTTILAQQHFDTFSERMAAFPVRIEMLSRFRTRARQKEIVREAAEGKVDIVIGTHRLLQRDIRFADLGLVIIDEEQRFGVAHKEYLKRMRELIDVLTLTATPIPRTLYMSLTGARDMSTIQTPPQDRLPVETLVVQKSDEVIRPAILREINRGGQVFYLHNRVISIYGVYEHLRQLVPEAKIAVAHGRMAEKELASIMHDFVRGEFDVLLCTTIIESGVDIPNVNTILIDRADRFGMADLYQLRGRVGRYKNKAYAYLLLPRHGHLFADARKRISAIKRYSSLGAGFKLALRDLEIRGAGNLLGAEQSGHIAAVGFDLYCQLLRRTVSHLKNEPAAPIIEVETRLDFIDLSPAPDREEHAAVIPTRYIEDENLRVNLYRRIAAAATEEEVDALLAEFRDRFGPVPGALDRLLKIARLRIVAAGRRITAVEVRENKLMMTRDNDYIMRNRRFPRLNAREPSARLDEMIADLRNTD